VNDDDLVNGTTPIIEKPSLRCAGGRFVSVEEALAWALTTADDRFVTDGMERLEISSYWAYPEGKEEGVKLYEASVTGTIP
jgi:hypothetical protein